MRAWKIVILAYLAVGLAFMSWFMLTQQRDVRIWYYLIWVIGFGLIAVFFKDKWRAGLQSWKASAATKFFLLGYGAVMLEEIIASLMNCIAVGFSFQKWGILLLQFWSFNILYFSGLIIGLFILTKIFAYSEIEIFFLAGLWGAYPERVVAMAPSNPVGFFIALPVITFVYGLIMTPAMLSITSPGRIKLAKIFKYLLTFAVIFILTLIMAQVIHQLAIQARWLFPPSSMMPIP